MIGDAGTGNSSQTAVRDAYYTFTGTRHTDLWLMLGDNAYATAPTPSTRAAVFNMYRRVLRKSVLWPTLGNHDGHTASSSSQTGPYYDIFTLPRSGEAGGVASGTEAYYSFDYGNIHFVCLDSYDASRSPTGAMLTWLQNDLAANTKDWLIAFLHHPPYTKGSHNSDTESELIEMRQNALPILESHGVDLVLSGHSHSYERSFLLDGHYGTSGTLDRGDDAGRRQRPRGRHAAPTPRPSLGPVPNEGAVYAVRRRLRPDQRRLAQPSGDVHLAQRARLDGARRRRRPARRAVPRQHRHAPRLLHACIKGGAAGNVPPTVAITSPANGATFTAPATVTITATASDSDGSVTQRRLLRGRQPARHATPRVRTASRGTARRGAHSLTAVATDDDGATRTSAAVSITVTARAAPATVSFQNGTAGYTGMVDASLRSDGATTNYGNATDAARRRQPRLRGGDEVGPRRRSRPARP